jgi:hypothetical protein
VNDDDGFMGYGDINVGANKKAQADTETTVDDTEMFNAYHQGAREQEPQEEEKEIKKENLIADSLINEDMEEINSSEHAVFEAVDRSNLPMTAKVTSVLSQELKNVSLDEIHFMLPVPDLSDITGVTIKVYLFGTKD